MWCVWLDGETVMVGDTMVFTGVGEWVAGFGRGGLWCIFNFGDDTPYISASQPEETRDNQIFPSWNYPLLFFPPSPY